MRDIGSDAISICKKGIRTNVPSQHGDISASELRKSFFRVFNEGKSILEPGDIRLHLNRQIIEFPGRTRQLGH